MGRGTEGLGPLTFCGTWDEGTGTDQIFVGRGTEGLGPLTFGGTWDGGTGTDQILVGRGTEGLGPGPLAQSPSGPRIWAPRPCPCPPLLSVPLFLHAAQILLEIFENLIYRNLFDFVFIVIVS